MSLRDKYTDEEWSELEKRSQEYMAKRRQEEDNRIFGNKKIMKAILHSGIKIKILEVLSDGRYKLLDGDVVTREEIKEIIEE
jgi:hypothetical protein